MINLHGQEFANKIIKSFVDTLKQVCFYYATNKTLDQIMFGRLSTSVFGVFLPNIDSDTIVHIVEKLQEEIKMIIKPEITFTLTTSIGISIFPNDALNADDLIKKADEALYSASEMGGDKYHFFQKEHKTYEKIQFNLIWKDKIHKAYKEKKFIPWYQPILEIKSNTIHHYETLARMKTDEDKLLLPNDFIPIAEYFGIVNLIDKQIMIQSLKKLKQLNELGNQLSFSLNLSGKYFINLKILDYIKKIIQQIGVNPQNIIFEITETQAIKNLTLAKEFVQTLKILGCKFALDDFGVGFTSFNLLNELSIDFVKIDGYFIKDIDTNSHNQVFVQSIVNMSKDLNIHTIAEFVENEAILNTIKKLGIDYAQGYFIGKPQKAEEIFILP